MGNSDKRNEASLTEEQAEQLSAAINKFRDSIYEEPGKVNASFNNFMKSINGEPNDEEESQSKEQPRKR